MGAEFICFIDSDCVPERNYGEKMLAALKDTTPDENTIVAGNTLSLANGWASNFHDIYGTLNGRILSDQKSLLYGCTCNLAMRLLSSLPQFDESFPNSAFEDVGFSM